MYILKGLFIVRKLDRAYWEEFQAKLKERKVTDKFIKKITVQETRGYGVITRNFAKLLYAIIAPYENVTVGGDQCINRTITVVDDGNNNRTVGYRGWLGYGDNWHSLLNMELKNHAGFTRAFGTFFRVGSGTTSPTPDDYNLSAPVQNIFSVSIKLLSNPDNTVVSLTGSDTASQDFTCSEVGLLCATLTYVSKSSTRGTGFYTLLDRAVLDTPIDFVAGDPINVQYKLTLA